MSREYRRQRVAAAPADSAAADPGDPRLWASHASPHQSFMWAASVLEEQLRRQAEDGEDNSAWFEDSELEPGSFLHCCAVLGLDVQPFRDGQVPDPPIPGDFP